jgi:hypothetical protein
LTPLFLPTFISIKIRLMITGSSSFDGMPCSAHSRATRAATVPSSPAITLA